MDRRDARSSGSASPCRRRNRGYEAVKNQVDLASIAERESVTRQTLARIDEPCALAGHEHIHRGMTSRISPRTSSNSRSGDRSRSARRLVALLARFSSLAERHAGEVMAARTHNVAAQATTLGKRFADVAERR